MTEPAPIDRFQQLLAQAAAPVQPDVAQDPLQVAAFKELGLLCAELERIAEEVPIAAVVPDMRDKLARLTQLVEQTGGIELLPVHYSDQLDIALLRMWHGQWLVTTADLDRVKAHFMTWHAPDARPATLSPMQRVWRRLMFRLTHKYPAYYLAYREKWVTQLPANPELARHPGPTLKPAERIARRNLGPAGAGLHPTDTEVNGSTRDL